MLHPDLYGWFAAKPRHFWFFKLNYDDADTQSLVRSYWLVGLILIFGGSVLVAVNNPKNQGMFIWILLEIAYLLVCVWILLKAILLIAIIVYSLWNWAVHGVPLIKSKKKKGEA